MFLILWRQFIAALWSPTVKRLTSLLLLVMFIVVFATFPFGILRQVWYLILSFPLQSIYKTLTQTLRVDCFKSIMLVWKHFWNKAKRAITSLFQFKFPSSAFVKAQVVKHADILNVFIQVPGFFKEQTEGLCGYFDYHPDNDLTDTFGKVNSFRSHPDHFSSSWR